MDWDWTRATVDPSRGGLVDGAVLFSVEGRSTHSLNAEFIGKYLGLIPESRAYAVTLEALTSKAEGWQALITWQFQAGNIKHPGNYFFYTNDPAYLTESERAEASKNLAGLRAKLPQASVN